MLYKLAIANQRKRKGYTFIIFSLILIAALLLSISLSIMIESNKIVKDTAENHNTSHSLFPLMKSQYKEDYYEWFLTNDKVKEVIKEEALYFSDIVMSDKNGAYDLGYLFINQYNENATIDRVIVLDNPRFSNLKEREIILPYVFQKTEGVKLDDIITLTIKGQDYDFTVAGFTMDVMFGSTITIAKQVWISDIDYQTILKPQSDDNSQMIKIKVMYHSITDFNEVETSFTDTFNPKLLFSLNLTMAKDVTTTTINLIMAILLFFSVFLFIIALFVIRYAIIVSIEADFVQIGIEKALGLTQRQINIISLLQYGQVCMFATIISIFISLISIPILGEVLFSSTGLKWQGNISFFTAILITFFFTLLISCFSLLISRKSRKVTPISAIRNGIASVHFQSRLNIDICRTKLPFILLYSIKQLTSKLKQYMMILIVTIILIFPLVFGNGLVKLFENPNSALTLLGFETTDISLIANSNHIEEVHSTLEDNNDITKIISVSRTKLKIENYQYEFTVSDDFKSLNTSNIYTGKNPEYNNEVALTSKLATTLKANLGDFITIKKGDISQRFLVVGLYQSIDGGGETARISLEGMRKFEPEFVITTIYLYLNEGVNVEETIKWVNNSLNDKVYSVVNERESMANIFEPISNSLNLLSNTLFVISLSLLIMISFFIANITVFKEIKDMGILKSLGFTSFQIARQIIYRLLIVITTGIILGIVLALLTSEYLFILLLSQFGIAKISMNYDMLLLISECIILVVVTFIATYLSTRKIKRITPYVLINE